MRVVAAFSFAALLAAQGAWAAEKPTGLPIVDPSVSPCQDFYAYACHAWMKDNPSPPDQARWGAFTKLGQDNLTILKDALEEAESQPKPGSERVVDFYRACMDETTVDARKAQPIEPLLKRIAALADKHDLAPLVAALHDAGVPVFFNFGAETDFEDARRDIAGLQQGGLGLPNRDFYSRQGDKDEQIRKDYLAHMAKIFQLMGEQEAPARAKAETVMRIETQLADQSLTLAQRRKPELTHHKLPTAELAKLAPDFDWSGYFQALEAPRFDTLNIAHPDFVKAVEGVVSASTLDDLKAYLAWQVARTYAPYLSKDFADENFTFYGKTLNGQPEIQPRWKRCVKAEDRAIGEDLGQYFVAAAFGAEHKKRMTALVKHLRAAYDADIDTLAWMSPETKKQAHAKLAAILDKIGYPDHWRDYSSLEIKSADLVGNIERSNAFETKRDLKKIGKPHDKTEWHMTPPTVNAYYSPAENDINFPAGILQPPFFTLTADDAVNYGAIGVVIGHEMTHGFDNSGRKYDKDGNLADWWTEDDAKKFTERAACIVDQYGAYKVGDITQNGEATQGENIADNGGLRIALDALHAALKGKKDGKIGGFSADQRFFLGFAQVWCTNARDDNRRTQALSDYHSLPEYRVNGTLSNSEAFAKAFHCKATDPMVRGVSACRIW
ncbi:MAG TPA: M13 family metallopeptidase [Magnetospirillaceae bacterium]|nr:M13 family metallopeptidase [Magnetospirillaceae bacterium]